MQTKRPVFDESMMNELAAYVGGIVNEWCNGETNLADCIEAAKKVLKWNKKEDGYALAKAFEDEGFYPDSELVDQLDSVWHESHCILERAEKQWVKDNNLTLELWIGDLVTFTDRRQGKTICEITKLYPDKYEYGVWFEGLGYKKETGCRILKAENVTLHSKLNREQKVKECDANTLNQGTKS